MTKPLLFISHKHSDRAIATVVRSFVTEQTSGNVRVFQSSDPLAPGPKVGRTLNNELRKALWEAKVVILVYTTADQDWGYCMWECGVATLPESPDTRIVVLQCGDAVPSLFAGEVRVDARQKLGIDQFVVQFMTDGEFLPGATAPLTGYEKSDPVVQRAAVKLFEDLQAVLPEGTGSEWPAHPFLQLQLGAAATKTICDAPADQRLEIARRTVLEEALVSGGDKYAQALFGMAEFDEHLRLDTLFQNWRGAHPKWSDAWIEALADQVGKGAQWLFPVLRWTAMPAVNDGQPHAPVLTRVRKVPAIGAMQFDVYFYPFNLLEATPAVNRMVPRADMFCHVLAPGNEGQVRIFDVLRALNDRQFNRVPFLDPEGRLVYIVHRSMLDQFVATCFAQGKVATLNDVSLADLFEEQPDIKAMFASTAAFIGSEGTLGEAKLAMNRTRNCYDVFVTESGRREEPVLGWITDVTIAASEPA